LDGLKDLIKQSKAYETNFKQPQNETRLSLKPTSRNKGDKTRMQHMRGEHLQKKSNMTNLGDEVGMRVNTLDMPQKAT
jgi:hypothetical protein